MSIGIGSESFDCSGLVIASISDVLGVSATDWPSDVRHVRDMWYAAEAGKYRYHATELAIGSLVVTTRSYRTGKDTITIPGHIGVVTRYDGANGRFVHASAPEGLVIESPFEAFSKTLGCITLKHY